MKDRSFRRAHRFSSRWESGSAAGPGFARGGMSLSGLRERGMIMEDEAGGLRVADLSPSRAAAMVRREFAPTLSLDEAPPRCAMVLYDTAAGMGAVWAARMAGQALGMPGTGQWNAAFRAALRRCNDRRTAAAMCHLRRARYCELAGRQPELRPFLRGWLGRVDALEYAVLHEMT